MKVVQVIARIITHSSGPAQSVPALCDALVNNGLDVDLCLLYPHILPDETSYDVKPFKAAQLPLAFRLGLSPKLSRGLSEIAKSCKVVHNHGLWMMPNIYPLKAVKRSTCRLVVSPRGTLSPEALSRSAFKKCLMRGLGQMRVLEQASLIHVTSEAEAACVRDLGLKAPIAVIPNGMDIVAGATDEGQEGVTQILFLGRIHPMKALGNLVAACVALQRSDWKLLVAGPIDSSYAAKLRAYAEVHLKRRVEFLGEVSGQEKRNLLAASDLLVLPSRSENFGMVVAEALAAATPVITTEGTPWAHLVNRNCGWWIKFGVGPLVDALNEALDKSSNELRLMGFNGLRLIEENYSWDLVGAKMKHTYEWLLDETASKPDWVLV